ncbi:MAG TPA: nuclear transport factor 2 family protein, partial [Gemmatimonadales bacterium]
KEGVFMSRLRVIAFVSTLSAFAVNAGAAQQQADVRTEVQKFVHQYIEAINRADAAGLMDMYARVPEVTSADNTDITHGWDAIRNDAASLAQSHYRMTLDTVDVVPLGSDYALAVAKANYSFGTPQGSLRVRGVLTLVLQKVGTAWKVLHDHSSSQNPSGD